MFTLPLMTLGNGLPSRIHCLICRADVPQRASPEVTDRTSGSKSIFYENIFAAIAKPRDRRTSMENPHLQADWGSGRVGFESSLPPYTTIVHADRKCPGSCPGWSSLGFETTTVTRRCTQRPSKKRSAWRVNPAQ